MLTIITDPKGRILRVSKLYEGRIHGFEIRKTEGPLLAIPILAEKICDKKIPLKQKVEKRRASPKYQTRSLASMSLLTSRSWPRVIAASSSNFPNHRRTP